MESSPLDHDRNETPTEGLDRNWDELLQELRVTQTGVQLLAGFLLTLPFQQRFATISESQRTAYLVALSSAVVATTLLVAPVSAHRLMFRRHAKHQLVGFADRAARVGLVTWRSASCRRCTSSSTSSSAAEQRSPLLPQPSSCSSSTGS